ncbi:hypothetical protein E8E12_000858 [Didymella heteroderae]|uniref:Uncharacterized protein n=1 Tax=Didymella heteroderae TaxID=1769908 RepID=A0A9P4WFN5_9PLEO|nr:hypothetical protein E8E12_000858 [Didymella heteroderae]
MLAADSIHHLVSACTVFGVEWPSWGNAVLLEWMGRRFLSNVLAEVDPISEEHQFVCRYIAVFAKAMELELAKRQGMGNADARLPCAKQKW